MKKRKKMVLSWICMMSLLLGLLAGCAKEVRDQTPEKNVVVIYDVEPQGREHMGANSTARMEELQQKISSGDFSGEAKTRAMEELKGMEELTDLQTA